MLDKIKTDLHIGEGRRKLWRCEPTPELIDVLWGYYLATGGYEPIESMIKLLPLANDQDNVDNLTTGSAAKFTLASNAVRDTDLLGDAAMARTRSQPNEIKPVLKDVIETAETVDTAAYAQGIARRNRGAQAERPQFEARAVGLGPGRRRARCRWAASSPPPPARSNWASLA